MSPTEPAPEPAKPDSVGVFIGVGLYGLVSMLAAYLAETKYPSLWAAAVAAALWSVVLVQAARSRPDKREKAKIIYGLVCGAFAPMPVSAVFKGFMGSRMLELEQPLLGILSAIAAAGLLLWLTITARRQKAGKA